jgi:hypothetical protein
MPVCLGLLRIVLHALHNSPRQPKKPSIEAYTRVDAGENPRYDVAGIPTLLRPQFFSTVAAFPNGRRIRMRALLAFILGILVTIGGIFVHDTMVAGTKPFVNWDTVHTTAGNIATMVHDQFNKK